MKFLLGTKLGMTQIVDEKGRVVPVTLVEAGPVVVTQVKSKEKDGYAAIQIGFGEKKHLTKPLKGHLKGLGSFRWLREYRAKPGEEEIKGEEAPKVGTILNVSLFKEGEKVALSGISKGKGFQGVVKRHGFKGMKATHGTKEKYRAPGTICSGFPQHVRKGKRMAGRMGYDRTTRHNVPIIKIDQENNLIAVKGAVPGARGTLVEIRG